MPNIRTLPRSLVAVLLLNITLAVCYVAFFGKVAADGDLWRADFTNFYTGWRMIREGHGANLYDLDLQTRTQQRLLAGRSFADGLLPFVNPPHSALPFVPLAWLSRTNAHLVWLLFNAGLLVYLVRRLLALAHDWRTIERWLLITAVLALPPLYTTFLVGAFSLLVTVCLLNAYLALRAGNQRTAALWLFVGTVKFQLVLLPAVWLVGARRWRAVGWGVGLSAAAFVVVGWLWGWQIWGAYAAVLRLHSDSYDFMGIHPAATYSFKGALSLALGRSYAPQINHIATLALGAAALASGWLGHRSRGADGAGIAWSFGLATLLGIVFNLHLYAHDVLTVLVPATLFYLFLRERQRPRRAFTRWILLAPLLFFGGDFIVQTSLGIQIPVVLLAVLLGWMAQERGFLPQITTDNR